MIAFILAGGKGTRLKEITGGDMPKPMVNIAGKPILQYQIEFLARNNIDNVILSLGYGAEAIKNYFKDGKRFDLSIIYSEEPEPLGTAGAFKYAEPLFGNARDILVLYGDIVFDIDLERLINFHNSHGGIGTLFVHPNDHPYDSDLLEVDNTNRILRFIPKPHPNDQIYQNLVNAGIYVLKPEVSLCIECEQKLDFGRDVFPKLVVNEKELYAYRSSEYAKDVGTSERYREVEEDILSGKVYRRNLKRRQKVVFLDRDGVINEEIDLLHRPEQLKLIDCAAEAVRKLNGSDYLGVVVTNQPVVARGLCSEKDIVETHKRMDVLLGEKGAFLDRIYYCPHHPDRGYPEENKNYKIECDCRKPKIGMLLEAEHDFNIERTESFLVGDTTTDIQTGINYGIQTILVKTGYKGLDGKFPVISDYEFENLGTAVDFIINRYPSYLSFCNNILDKSEARFILLGGNARSGKSTLASVLKHCLNIHGKETRILSLDNWLLPASIRKEGMDVYARYNKDRLLSDMKLLLSGKSVKLQPYDPYTRDFKDKELEISIPQKIVLIVEGVVALGIDDLRKMADTKVFVEIEEKLRKERFYSFYQYKGFDGNEIDSLYCERFNEEVSKISATKKYADYVFQEGINQ